MFLHLSLVEPSLAGLLSRLLYQKMISYYVLGIIGADKLDNILDTEFYPDITLNLIALCYLIIPTAFRLYGATESNSAREK